MNTHLVLADLYVRNTQAGSLAFSALPNAPVLPVDDRGSIIRRALRGFESARSRSSAVGGRRRVVPTMLHGRS